MYKVEVVTEGRLGALLFGGSNMPTNKIENKMNEMEKNGFFFQFMVVEEVRNMIFWKRQRTILTFVKKGTYKNHGGL